MESPLNSESIVFVRFRNKLRIASPKMFALAHAGGEIPLFFRCDSGSGAPPDCQRSPPETGKPLSQAAGGVGGNTLPLRSAAPWIEGCKALWRQRSLRFHRRLRWTSLASSGEISLSSREQ